MAVDQMILRHQTALGYNDEAIRQLRWIASDARHAARSFTRAELGAMVLSAGLQAGYQTARTQIGLFRGACKLLCGLGRVNWRTAPADLRRFFQQLPQRTLEKFAGWLEAFSTLPRQDKEDEIVSLFLSGLIFVFVSGGKDLEGGLPDKDMVFGMGAHRHILSHTILLGLGLEFTLRLWLTFSSKAYQRLPQDHHPVWDRLRRILAKSESWLVAAGWLGIGAHLTKDGSLLAGSTKPLVGLPFRASMDLHQLIMHSNALAAGLIGMGLMDATRWRLGQWVEKGLKHVSRLRGLRRGQGPTVSSWPRIYTDFKR